MMKIKRILIFVVVTSLFTVVSCKKIESTNNTQMDNISLDNMLFDLGKDIENDCILLRESLRTKTYSFDENANELIFLKIRGEIELYYDYLNDVDSISIVNNENVYYTNDDISEKGKEFIKKSSEIVKILKDEVKNDILKERIDLLLGVKDVRNEDGVYFEYLEYNYYGVPYKTFNYLTKMRKRDLLLIEKEVLEILSISN